MDKHKLIKLILKDLEELNEIASELKSTKSLSKFELDIALSKSKLIHQEFQFLRELNDTEGYPKRNESSSQSLTTPVLPEPEITEEVKDKLVNEITPSDREIAQEKAEEVAQPENQTKEQQIKEDDLRKGMAVPPAVEEQEEDEKIQTPPEKIDQAREEVEEDTNEEKASSSPKTVGENFIKGKSLNDLLLESKTLDQKLASSPIIRLESAIGLNDRFQYTRELFNNDPKLFIKTVRKIDESENLDEAVNYLNSNFKWKKTDTSIQFAQLVKRRFTN